MTRNRRQGHTFAHVMLVAFVGFSIGIFALLWLLQGVLLRTTYIHTLQGSIATAADQAQAVLLADGETSALDQIASTNAALIVVADEQGELLYGTDEHSSLYVGRGTDQGKQLTGHSQEPQESNNPYHPESDELSWTVGTSHYLAAPSDFGVFLQRLAASQDASVSYELDDGSALVYGRALPSEVESGRWAHAKVLYLSASVESASATAAIVRSQLLVATIISLALATAVSYVLARRLSQPVETLSAQAESLSAGAFDLQPVALGYDELDHLEEALVRAAHDLGEADEARRHLFANVAHDLRTPLTLIRGYAEMVRDVSGDDTEQRTADLDVILRESDRLTALVNDVLSYSALQDEGAHALSCAPFDLGTCVHRVSNRFAPLCAQRSGELRIDAPASLVVLGDERQIERVLYNLIGNAVEHAEGGPVYITLCQRESSARVEIRDSGAGIPADELDGVWERYFSKEQLGRASMSSGLGLAISKEILIAHEAPFGVISEEGSGAIFWFELARA